MSDGNHSDGGSSATRPDEHELDLFPDPPEQPPPASDEVPPPAPVEAPQWLNRKEAREWKRQQRLEQSDSRVHSGESMRGTGTREALDTFIKKLAQNENEMVLFMHQVNEVYHSRLRRPAPFMRYIILGLQSTGKSTILERMLKFPMNIVAEGTGTRCPLYVTCIQDPTASEPVCTLSGGGLEDAVIAKREVFKKITEHNSSLDGFSSEPLRLTVKSKVIQNMMFVDLPGIITTKDGGGSDNREGIKEILRGEMSKPNTELVVLLEPKEYQTNSIIDFLDESCNGNRKEWFEQATFVMNKFDLRLPDSKTGSKTNAFFSKYHENSIFPYMVINPTMEASPETMSPQEQYDERQRLLDSSEEFERSKFTKWNNVSLSCEAEILHPIASRASSYPALATLQVIDEYYSTHPNDCRLDPEVEKKEGFPVCTQFLRKRMLEDTARRLPDVIRTLRDEKRRLLEEIKRLEQANKYNDPAELKNVVSDIVHELRSKIIEYLDGSLRLAQKFPEKLQVLDDEINEEEESDWVHRKLNFHTEGEEAWRDHISKNMDFGKLDEHVQPDVPLIGGKQYQRAFNFFKAVMIERLPEPFDLKEYVPTALGALRGGLNREDWEHATVEIIKASMSKVTHPGINFFIKHVGVIFKRLIHIALADCKQGESRSDIFELLPPHVEKWLISEYNSMIWKMMDFASSKTHSSLQPMYSTVNPNLPTFTSAYTREHENERTKLAAYDHAVARGRLELLKNSAPAQRGFIDGFRHLIGNATSGRQVKDLMHADTKGRITRKQIFLPGERATMITKEESERIVQTSFAYMTGLMEFIMVTLEFAFNHYLFHHFKSECLEKDFGYKMINDADWKSLVHRDEESEQRLVELYSQLEGISSSLETVQVLQQRFR
ncbi:MAG: hypothetical protein SGPRY_008506 [Prymnesium sp.]